MLGTAHIHIRMAGDGLEMMGIGIDPCFPIKVHRMPMNLG